MADKDKAYDIIEEVKETVQLLDDVVDGANDIVDATEEVGKKAGGLLERIKHMFIKIIAYFKNLFKKD